MRHTPDRYEGHSYKKGHLPKERRQAISRASAMLSLWGHLEGASTMMGTREMLEGMIFDLVSYGEFNLVCEPDALVGLVLKRYDDEVLNPQPDQIRRDGDRVDDIPDGEIFSRDGFTFNEEGQVTAFDPYTNSVTAEKPEEEDDFL
jgi:hypothetical protein